MTGRNQAVEALRVLSAFGIVYYHSQAPFGHEIAYSGLIIFIILSAYFSARRTADTQEIKNTLYRFLIPWFLWFLIYGALDIHLHIPLFNDGISSVLAGSSIHLWYLPWACLCVVLTRLSRRWLTIEICGFIATVLSSVTIALLPLWRPISISVGAPWAQYIHATSPFFWGIILAQPPGSARKIQCVCVLISLSYLVFVGFGDVFIAYASGFIACLTVFYTYPYPSTKTQWQWLQPIANSAYGIYLCHILVFWFLAHFVETNTLEAALGCFISAMACTILFKACWERINPFTRMQSYKIPVS